MDFFTLTIEELNALEGMPYIQQVLYFRGIRRYMDHKTGIVGIKRRISYQSLREALYVEPIAGVQTIGSPSHQQIRRAIKQLTDKGLIEIIPAKRQLIFKCVLAVRDRSVQNKADIRPTYQADSKPTEENTVTMRDFGVGVSQADRPKTPQADTPHKDNNYLFLLSKNFEAFWESYPQKQGKQKAWEIFQALNLDETFIQKILKAIEIQVLAVNEKKAMGIWVPNWKNPANWLSQHCWEDEITPITKEDRKRASHSENYSKPTDMFWESCKSGATYEPTEEGKVINFSTYQKGA